MLFNYAFHTVITQGPAKWSFFMTQAYFLLKSKGTVGIVLTSTIPLQMAESWKSDWWDHWVRANKISLGGSIREAQGEATGGPGRWVVQSIKGGGLEKKPKVSGIHARGVLLWKTEQPVNSRENVRDQSSVLEAKTSDRIYWAPEPGTGLVIFRTPIMALITMHFICLLTLSSLTGW